MEYNQRPLQFRAWDKLQGKFLYPYPEAFNILGEVTCFDLIGEQLKEFTPEKTTLERLNDVIITQYTGLNDKNGKKIFEGDIVNVLNIEPSMDLLDEEEKWEAGDVEVVFDEGVFGFEHPVGGHAPLFAFDIREMQVIGNIFEGE